MPHDITHRIRESLIKRSEADIDRFLSSVFTPRECRFLVFYQSHDLRREKDPYALFPEHIPFTRRDLVLAYYRYLHDAIPPKHHYRMKLAIDRLSRRYPQKPLLKSDMVVLYKQATPLVTTGQA